MKTLIILLVVTMSNLALLNAQSVYSYYNGQRQYYTPVYSKKYVVTKIKSSDEMRSKFKLKRQEILHPLSKELGSINLRAGRQRNLNDHNWAIVENADLAQSGDDVLYQSSFYKTKDGREIGLSNFFYVKLRSEDDVNVLESLATYNNVDIVGKNQFMPLWYTLSCTKESRGNALEMANLFYESTKFSAAEPDFMSDDLHCVNDQHFNSQWALTKMSWCNAQRVVTHGCSNIVVAVLDQGFELNHPDFANVSPISFDTESGTSPSQVLGDHGTACAGIIGAASNNTIGVAGVAPGARLMSISNSLAAAPNSRQRRADGINFAWQNGAHIISNSWGSAVSYQIIDDAITAAVTQGRGGLGTLVVFATGNDSAGSIGYPSNNVNVIAVGASTSTDTRASFSNYGTGIDVIAPGVGIYTTDRQGGAGYNTTTGVAGNYTPSFEGTSAACPQVAGVLALILEANPNLTAAQARQVLEANVDKISGYSYATTSGQPNGTWNSQVGYGRVNAQKAVLAARGLSITGANTLCVTTGSQYAVSNLPGGTPLAWTSTANIAITSSGVANFVANGPGTIFATVNFPCPITLSKSVGGVTASFTGPSYIAVNNTGTFNASANCTGASFDWWIQNQTENLGEPYYIASGQTIMLKSVTNPSLPNVMSRVFGLYVVAFDNNLNRYQTTVRLVSTKARGDLVVFGPLLKAASQFSVHPNPTVDFVDVSSIEHQPNESFTVNIYDANGTRVMNREIAGNNTTIDVTSLKEGTYYVEVVDGSPQPKQRLMIKR